MSANGVQQLMEGVKLGNEDDVRASVSKYYGETLQKSSDLKTSACCTAKSPPKEAIDILRQLPQEIISKYYGCGSPFPRGLMGSGLRVLDLGCGSGRDCYVCAALVGEKGFLTGIDMTPAQLEVAEQHSAAWQQHLGYAQPNMKFVKGSIEQLDAAGIPPASVDIVISNCVINLSPDKAAVLQQVHRVLAPGGEMYFSDVYCDRRLPAEVRSHEVLLGECLGGALAVDDFVHLAQQAGFHEPRVLEAEPITVHDSELKALLGDAAFYSITFRLFKLPDNPFDAQPQPAAAAAAPSQVVTYRGGLSGSADSYELDYEHKFITGVPVLVSSGTAAICKSSWLSAHFSVTSSSSCCAPKPQQQVSSTPVTLSSIAALVTDGSGSGGSCCVPAAAATAPAAIGNCCGPAAESKGCCPTGPSTNATAVTASSCCPQPGACCPPAAAADAVQPVQPPAAANGCCGGGKCC